MKRFSSLLIAASAGALGACGSNDPAPVVYGTSPESTGRIYNSPEDYARVNRTAQPVRVSARPTPAIERSAPPAPIAPVIEARTIEPMPASADLVELPPAPTYISLNDPETLRQPVQKAGEFVTVRSGDTVYAISRRSGASPDAIIAENRLRAPYTLTVGQRIAIPAAEEKIENRITRAEPVRVQTAAAPASSGRAHTVRSGDTLYSISRSTGASVQEIARANALRSPYTLDVGQTLRIPGGSAPVRATREVRAPERETRPTDLARTVSYTQPAAPEPERMFEWPVKGAILGRFGTGDLGKRNDGVNIAAPVGTPVRAAADGEVVYRGSEVEGYGNLLLIRHDDGFVTAYAHNDAMLVKKGQKVNKGQMIAKVGQSGDVTEPQLHFEIRQNLKSVDPLAFLDN